MKTAFLIAITTELGEAITKQFMLSQTSQDTLSIAAKTMVVTQRGA